MPFVSLLVYCSVGWARTPSTSGPELVLDFCSDIHVRKDASLSVKKTIRVHSEGIQIHQGIYRDFPSCYCDRLGNCYVVDFEILEVTRDGQPEEFHEEAQSNGERISVTREVGFFSDHDKFYWNGPGTVGFSAFCTRQRQYPLPSGVPASPVHMDGYIGA